MNPGRQSNAVPSDASPNSVSTGISGGALETGDDGFDRPTVTPVPAPPDDQLIRLAAVGTILSVIGTLIVGRWLHKHLEIRWRS